MIPSIKSIFTDVHSTAVLLPKLKEAVHSHLVLVIIVKTDLFPISETLIQMQNPLVSH